MLQSLSQKLVFFGGKGGVGKTTCASAFALLAAQSGRKTLLVSTDTAHSLSDIFQIKIENRETPLQANLFGLEIDPDEEAAIYLNKIKTRFRESLDAEAFRTFTRQLDFAAVSPGTQEAALFDKVTDLIDRLGQDYDLLVFDTAPTGQTLRLLALPELLGNWIENLTRQRRKVSSFWKMFSRVSDEPDGEDPVLELLNRRREKFGRAKLVLCDPSKTGFYMVLVPERLSVLETQKAIPVLVKYGIPIRGMIVNRLLPKEAEDGFLKKRKEQEASYLKEIATSFGALRPVYLYQQERDVGGMENLKNLAQKLEPLLKQTGPPS